MNKTNSKLRIIQVEPNSSFRKILSDIKNRGNYPKITLTDGSKLKGNINSIDRNKVKIGRKVSNFSDINTVDEVTRKNDRVIMRYKKKAIGSTKKSVRKIVVNTVQKEGGSIDYANRVVTSLMNAGVPQKVSNPSNIKRIVAFTRQKIKTYNKINSPLKHVATASNYVPMCPYCKQPMIIVRIAGDLINKVVFCKQDKISLPLISEN